MTLSSSTYYQWYIKNILHQVKDNYLHLIELSYNGTTYQQYHLRYHIKCVGFNIQKC